MPIQPRALTEGPIGRTLFGFALPILGGNVLQSLNGSVNAVRVGRFLGEEALTAIANANNIMFLLLGGVFGFGMASTILVGQAMGRKDLPGARKVIGSGALEIARHLNHIAVWSFLFFEVTFVIAGVCVPPMR